MTSKTKRAGEREALEPTYTAEEVARHYHVTVTTVRRWVAAGAITAINVSRSSKGPLVFRHRDLEAFDRRSLTGYKTEAVV